MEAGANTRTCNGIEGQCFQVKKKIFEKQKNLRVKIYYVVMEKLSGSTAAGLSVSILFG